MRGRLRAAQAGNQRLRDEINRLKGEQGMPTIKANTPQPPRKDHSSERERRTPKTWSKGRKTACIAVDREQVVSVDTCRTIAAGCRVQRLRGRRRAGHGLPH